MENDVSTSLPANDPRRKRLVPWLKHDILSSALQDWVGVYEVVWATDESLPPDERLALARQVVDELASEELVDFGWMRWLQTQPERRADREEVESELAHDAGWEPPTQERPRLWMEARETARSQLGRVWQDAQRAVGV
jgi:hypothetical protein